MIILPNDALAASRSNIYDVCICGTGFAGLSIAMDLAQRGHKIALLEGGGTDWSDESQELYHGTTTVDPGMYYTDKLEDCRLRFFGGTSYHWYGVCIPFEKMDFSERKYLNLQLPGWPIQKSAIDPYFKKSAEFLDITVDDFSRTMKEWSSDTVRTVRSASSPPTRLNEKYFDYVKNHKNIHCYLLTNLVEIVPSKSLNTINRFRCISEAAEELLFHANYYVLACGAIENARILLNSDQKVHGGIGNGHDMVGRCFMEHFVTRVGRFLMEDRAFWNQVGDLGLTPTESFVSNKKILNISMSYYPDANPGRYGRLALLKDYIQGNICKSDTLTSLARKLSDFDCPGDGLVSMSGEQSPNIDSRVYLDTSRDRFGMRRVILNWRATDLDRKTIRTFAIEVGKEMARQKIARVQFSPYIVDESLDIYMGGQCHHMGTTRMSENPKHGVVDSNCRVHGLENMFIAGSSVFATCGANNPTLPIVQFSYRLAEHLSSLLR